MSEICWNLFIAAPKGSEFPYNPGMLKLVFARTWLPAALQKTYPLTRYYLRKPPSLHIKQVVFGSSLGLFLLFGGLSLPMLYFLFSLIVLLQLATSSTHKMHQARVDGLWDLLNLSSLRPGDILLSTWAAGVWQIRQSWLMLVYRLSHALLLIGVLIFALVFSDIQPQKGMALVLATTLLIALQPYTEMYFSGMIGLLCAAVLRDRLISIAAAGAVVLLYWTVWIAGALMVAFVGLKNLPTPLLMVIFALPLIVPAAIGYLAQQISLRHFRDSIL